MSAFKIYHPLLTSKPCRLWVLTMMLLAGISVQAQQYNAGDGWILGVSGGVVSFYGDLSINDDDPLMTLTTESDAGFSATLTKQLGSLIAVKAGLLAGSMRGHNPDLKSSFKSDFNELSLMADLNITRLIAPSYNMRFRTVAFAGLGLINSSVTKTPDFSTSPEKGSPDNGPQVLNVKSEPVLVSGVGLDYAITRKLKVAMQLSLHTTRTDALDAHVGTSTSANDHYTYLSAGLLWVITYHNNSLVQSYPCSPW